MDGFTSKIPKHDEKLKTLLSNNGFVIHAKGAGCGVNCETLVWKKHESFLQSNKNVFMFMFMFAILLLAYSMYIM